MASPINPHNNSAPQAASVKNDMAKPSQAKGPTSQGAPEDDQASISGIAKQLNQAGDVGTTGLGREQAQLLASELKELFSREPQQALAGQAGKIDDQVRELLKQSA